MRRWTTVCLRGSLIVSPLVALLLAGGANAANTFTPRAQLTAKAAAARTLAAARLPRRARKVRGDQSIGRVLGPPPTSCTRRCVSYESAFWRVSGQPAAVWAWMRKHTPAGSGSIGTEISSRGRYSLQFWFSARAPVVSRYLNVTVAAAKGGGSAIRTDGIAIRESRNHSAPCFSAY